MIEVDLHLHTAHSDGVLTPAQLIALCVERGLRVISVTDHDTTNGLPEAMEAAAAYPDLTVIPGIELSADVPGSEIHILGYYVDHEDAELQAVLHEFRDGRVNRARRMVKNLNGMGVSISWERVQEIAGDAAIGRPHIAQALVEAGYVKYSRDAFDKYIGRNGPAYAERSKLTPEDAIRLLRERGAVPVMAHPTYSAAKSDRPGFDPDSLSDALSGMKDAGLAGMEVHYGDYTEEQTALLLDIAQERGLIACGGSDYHGLGNPGEPEPGSVGPPMAAAEALQELRAKAIAASVRK